MAKTKKSAKPAAIILVAIQAVLSVALVWLLMDFDMLPYKYLNLLVLGLTALLAITAVLACFKKLAFLSIIFSVIFSLVLGVGIYYFVQTEKTLKELGESEDTVNFTVLTRTADSLNPDGVLANGRIAVVESVMDEYVGDAKAAVSANWKGASFVPYDSYAEAVEAFLAGETDGLLFFEGFRDMMEETFPNLIVDTAIVKTIALEEKEPVEESTEDPDPDESGEESDEESNEEYEPEGLASAPFCIALLGTDFRANEIKEYTLHDVNMLAVVNPITKIVLLISVPRDYYVDVNYSSMKDKLTHAGSNSGPKGSMYCLNKLFGTDATHYVKIGFNGFKAIVDSLGGIDVYSEVAFESYWFGNPHYKYVAGINHLNGDQALAFVRERYNLDSLGGDRQRGRNQVAAIKAIVQKLESPAVLANYLSLLDSIKDMVRYNFTAAELASLVKMQLHDNTSWSIYSYSVNGSGAMDYTASYPKQELYVMKPTQSTINNAKKYIQEVLDGKKPSIAQ